MEEKQRISGKYLMVMLAMCGFAGSAVGMVINSSGVFFTPVAETFGIGRAAVSMTLTISTIAAASAALFVPKLMKPKTMKPLFSVGSMMMVLGTLCLSLVPNIGFMYAMNVVRGLGSGLIHLVTAATLINNWFYSKNGLMTSIAMCFSGIAGAVLSPVMTMIMNAAGWRTAYIVMAVIMAVFCLPGLLLPFTLTPAESGLKPYGYQESEKCRLTEKVSDGTASIRPAPFILAIVTAASANFAVAMSQHLPNYAETLGFSAAVGSFLVSLALAGNIFAKLVAGSLTDVIGARNAILVMAVLDGLAYILLLTDLGQASMYAGSLLFGCGYGIGAVGVTMMCRALFGSSGFNRAYPVVSFIGTVTNAAASTVIGLMYDAAGNYTAVLVLDLVLVIVICAVDILAFRNSTK